MYLIAVVICALIAGVVAPISFCAKDDTWLDARDRTAWKVVCCVSSCLFVASILGVAAYCVAPEKIEKEIICPVYEIEDVQYIQHADPDTGLPVIVNVNEEFEKRFYNSSRIKVTVFSEGPYNGIYERPAVKYRKTGC